MRDVSLNEQIDLLKQNCELQVFSATYKQRENLAMIESQIRGFNQEKSYYETRIKMYESLNGDDSSSLSDDILATIAELRQKVSVISEKLQVLVGNLEKEQVKYDKAYTVASEKASKKYRSEVQKLMKEASKGEVTEETASE